MIYLDSSVALAQLLAEDRRPPAAIWDRPLVASRLLEYEVWTRIHGRGLTDSHAEVVRALLGRVAFLEMIPEVLGRLTRPFPHPVRALDAFHLASIDFLREQGVQLELATYDQRMATAAKALDIALIAL